MKDDMNLAELQRKLFAAARAHTPSERVPYAFEKRIMARLMGRTATDLSGMWARALWRAAVSCIALALLLSAWSWLSPASASTPDFSQVFESTVLAAADQATSPDTLW